jgi:hypothetical protein
MSAKIRKRGMRGKVGKAVKTGKRGETVKSGEAVKMGKGGETVRSGENGRSGESGKGRMHEGAKGRRGEGVKGRKDNKVNNSPFPRFPCFPASHGFPRCRFADNLVKIWKFTARHILKKNHRPNAKLPDVG